MESGIFRLLGFQAHRITVTYGFVHEARPSGISSVPPLLSMMNLLSRKPLRRHKMCSHYQGQNRSVAWEFAVTMLQPDLLAELAGFSRREVRHFTTCMCIKFYSRTARLLAKARTGRMGSVMEEDEAALREHLETIYCLITHHDVQDRLSDFFATEVDQKLERQARLAQELGAKHDLEAKHSATFNAKKMAEDAEDNMESFMKAIKMQQLMCSGFLDSIRGEGWGHLQAFARHRLRKLRGGHSRYSEVIVRNFQLHTLCRINPRDEIEDEGQPNLNQQFEHNVVAEVCRTFRSLDRPGDKAPYHHVPPAVSCVLTHTKSQMGLMSVPCHHQSSRRIVTLVSDMLDAFENEVTAMEATRGSNRLWSIPPDNVEDGPLDPKNFKLKQTMYVLDEFGKPGAPFLKPSKVLTLFRASCF